MPEWAWRCAFFAGGLGSILVFLHRKKLASSVKHTVQQHKVDSYWQYICSDIIRFGRALIVGGLSSAPYMIFSIFMTNYVGMKFHLQFPEQIKINLAICSAYVLFYPLWGLLADYVGRHITMSIASLSLGILGFATLFFVDNLSMQMVISLQILLNIMSMGFSSGANGFLGDLHPKSVRCRGMTVSLTLGGALLGALIPGLAQKCLDLGLGLGPIGVYFLILGLLAFLAVNSGSHGKFRFFMLKGA